MLAVAASGVDAIDRALVDTETGGRELQTEVGEITLEEERAVLIAGGRDKLGAYAPLATALGQRGRAVVVLGEAADRIAEAMAGVLPIHRADTLDDAVRQAAALAQPGDAVLLSPACSSYDMFKSYKARGEAFAEAVATLGGDA